MASSLETLRSILEGEIGYRETGQNLTKYNKWLGRISGYPHDGYGYPWCASFASWAYAKAGVSAPRTASCLAGVSWYQARKQWGAYPRAGAQVFYGPGGKTHTEIVVAVSSTHITTIGGNTGGSLGGAYYNGDGVYKKRVRRAESRIYGYGYPIGLKEDDLSAEDVWEKDIIPAPRSSSTYETNPTWKASSYLRDINERVRALQSVVNRLEGRAAASVDPQAVASEVLRVLTPQAIAAAIPAELAAEVLDEMKRRL